MAKTNDVLLKKRLELIYQLDDKYSKKALEDFFGISIKEIDEKKDLYNVYKDGKLVLANIYSWEIEGVFSSVASYFVNRMCEEAEKENDLEETQRKVAELEKQELENEKQNYYTCPICNEFVKKGTHFHF